MASGMIVHFTINPDLVGIAIGKKGARIKQVEKDSGVTSVNVDGKSGTTTSTSGTKNAPTFYNNNSL